MDALVTGGAGFIGSALVRLLLADPANRVVTVDKLTYAANPLTVAGLSDHPRHVLEPVDIADGAALAALFDRHRPDTVFHLAAESHVDRSIDAPADFIRTNIEGTFRLLEAARAYWEGLERSRRDAFRLIHVSTDEVYGSLEADGLFSETSPYAPRSPYAASKASADHLASAWQATYGLPVIVTNCTNNYGPRQFPEKFIPLLILNGRAGAPLPLYGDGLNVRDWLHVEDHARALALIAARASSGGRYMIGGGSERTNAEVAHAICALLDEALPASPHRPHAGLIRPVADRPGHDRRYGADFSRLTADLGWRPAESFASGLAATVRWYLDNPDWCAACGGDARARRGLRWKILADRTGE
jgi:dTDP-glucose 4,6-dehydratase